VPEAAAGPEGFSAERALALAAQTFEIEARALQALSARQGEGFVQAVQAMLACRGRTVVMGIGKSGHVGRKIAATLASTGTPSFFVHPAEASHGDLGMVTAGDVVLAISNSGESDELAALLPALRRLSVTLVAMTGKPQSALARHADRLARALAMIANILDPDVIVLGGGLSNMAHLYRDVPGLMARHGFGDVARTPVVQAKHGDSSGVFGAARLWDGG
jgi:D-arabinose 5-phosphate isomerase GutQ